MLKFIFQHLFLCICYINVLLKLLGKKVKRILSGNICTFWNRFPICYPINKQRGQYSINVLILEKICHLYWSHRTAMADIPTCLAMILSTLRWPLQNYNWRKTALVLFHSVKVLAGVFIIIELLFWLHNLAALHFCSWFIMSFVCTIFFKHLRCKLLWQFKISCDL